MEAREKRRVFCAIWLLISLVQVMFLRTLVMAEISDVSVSQRRLKGRSVREKSEDRKEPASDKDLQSGQAYKLSSEEDVGAIVQYIDASGSVVFRSAEAKDLPASWAWQKPDKKSHDQESEHFVPINVKQTKEIEGPHSDGQQSAENQTLHGKVPIDPLKLERRELREKRKNLRVSGIIEENDEFETKLDAAALARSRKLDTSAEGQKSLWKREHGNPKADSTLKLMLDQIIMADVYWSIAKSKHESKLASLIRRHIKNSRAAIGEANSDAELHPRALDRAKEMGHILSMAKEKFYDCSLVAKKLRAMVQTSEWAVTTVRKKNVFLSQLAAKTIPKTIHCLSLHLSAEYYLVDSGLEETLNSDRLENPSLFHYAIFSDNLLATSVVVNSTMSHVKEPEKHVFHVVTDRLNFAAMKMWFYVNSPAGATVEVQNIDDFKWLNSSYCPVLRQLESSRIKEYYFRANHPSTLSEGDESLKYRNPKYLSMLNHLRFYLPEVYPKLDKILFLDDDIVVQKDLTPLWSFDLQGMVNGAVETCKESFHRFHTYLNFSNIAIAQNFDPNACGWAYGMNIFDLKEWQKRNITGIYHHWQNMNEDRTLWKLGSLPPGLITFYNLTYPMDRSWHVLGLGYDAQMNKTEIENAGVIHYNGNAKPWLELALPQYRSYWSKYVMSDNPYLKLCNKGEI